MSQVQNFTCDDNSFCKNLDLFNSEPGNLVYRCPNATCSLGGCNCGPECIKDTRTKICVHPNSILNPTYEPGTLPPPITSSPLSGAPVPLPTQEVLYPTYEPGTLPPSITSKPLNGAPVPLPTQEVLYPIPTPPLDICTITQLATNSFVCWKRVEDEANKQFIVNCDPAFCGLDKKIVKGVSKFAGANVTVYGNADINESPEDKNSEIYLILACVFGGICVLFFIYFITFYILPKTRKVTKRSRRFG